MTLNTLGALALFSLAIIASPAFAETLLRVATPGALTGALPIYLGSKKGIFQKYGLNVEFIATRSEQMNMQALMSLEYIWGINLTGKSFLTKNRETVKN